MMNTFENADRQYFRRKERERHMRIMDTIHYVDGTFQPPFDNGDQLPNVDALVGIPLARSDEDIRHFAEKKPDRFRNIKSNKFTILAAVAIVLVVLLAFTLGMDVGEEEVMAQERDQSVVSEKDQGGRESVDDSTLIHQDNLQRYNRLFNQVLDWGVTSEATLKEAASAPGCALNWLAYDDILTANSNLAGASVDTVRTRFTLATLYFATQGRSFLDNKIDSSTWTRKDNWLSAFSVCQWYGVTCLGGTVGGQSLGLVSGLNLTQNGLAGTVPDELSLLHIDIRSLDLSFNAIGGTIPGNISALKNLNTLYLGPNNFTSTLPEGLFQLTHLVHLYTNDCRLTGKIPSSIGNLQVAESIGLYNNALDNSIPMSIGSMTRLKALYLDGNALTGFMPSTIGLLTDLYDLRLSRNQLTGSLPQALDQLTLLEILYLFKNQLSGSLSGSIFASSKLQEIQIQQNAFSSRIPSEIGLLVSMSHFYADDCLFTGHIPSEIGSLHDTLEGLWLFENNLEGFLPSQISEMTRLTSLKLQENSLSGPLPNVKNLLKLESLLLNNNTFGGNVGAGSFADLLVLKELTIHGNRVTGSIPPSICTLPLMTELTADCAGNRSSVTCTCCTACYFQ